MTAIALKPAKKKKKAAKKKAEPEKAPPKKKKAPPKKKARDQLKSDPQLHIDEVEIENSELLESLDLLFETKEAAAENRKARASIADITVKELEQFEGKRVRIGRYALEIHNDPGGVEVQGYTTTGGIKAKKISAAE